MRFSGSGPIRTMAIASLVAGAFLAPPLEAAVGGGKYWARAIPTAWFSELDGDFRYSDDGSSGDDFSLEDFGLDSVDFTPMVEAGLRLPILVELHGGASFWNGTGDATFTDSRTFGGITFTASENVDVEAWFWDYYLEAAIRPLSLPIGGVAIGGGAHIIYAEIHMESESSGKDTFEDTAVVPMVSARAWFAPIKSVSAEARVHWMSVEVDEVDATFTDAQVMVIWRPLVHLGGVVGYRAASYDILYDISAEKRADIDITFQGPFVGGILQF